MRLHGLTFLCITADFWKKHNVMDFLLVQWLRFYASNAGATGSIPSGRTEIPYAMQHSQKKKKSTVWKLRVKSYFGQKEDYNPGDSIEKLRNGLSETSIQRALRNCSKEVGGGGEGHYICDFGEREEHAIKQIFLQKVSAGHVDLLVITMNDS